MYSSMHFTLTDPQSTSGVRFSVVQTIARCLVDQFLVLGLTRCIRTPVPLHYAERSAQTDHEHISLILDRQDERYIAVAL